MSDCVVLGIVAAATSVVSAVLTYLLAVQTIKRHHEKDNGGHK